MTNMENAPAATRLHRAGAAIAEALIAEPRPNARDLSRVLRDQLTEPDCIYMAAAAVWAMRPRAALGFAEAVEHDAIASMQIPADRIGATAQTEAERQRRRWVGYCARTWPEARRRARR